MYSDCVTVMDGVKTGVICALRGANTVIIGISVTVGASFGFFMSAGVTALVTFGGPASETVNGGTSASFIFFAWYQLGTLLSENRVIVHYLRLFLPDDFWKKIYCYNRLSFKISIEGFGYPALFLLQS